MIHNIKQQTLLGGEESPQEPPPGVTGRDLNCSKREVGLSPLLEETFVGWIYTHREQASTSC